jgi:hypothetical protein
VKKRSKTTQSTTTTTPLNRRDIPGESPALARTTLVAYAIALVIVAVGYSAITNHIWEDTLITLRSAENVANGDGLTYHVGTRVHTFTSPINVLLLAVSYLLTGKGSYVATIWVYRVFSIAAFAGSGVLLLQAAAKAVPRWSLALWWLAIVYLFDGKSVVFSTNGMETAFMLLFLAWALYLLSPPDATRWLARGLCWAGLMWSRPDGCVYIAALMIAELLFSGVNRKDLVRSYARSAVVGLIVYGPWFFWAWSYYGSPVPNTVAAKSHPLGAMAEFWYMVDGFPEQFLDAVTEVFRHLQSSFGFLLEDDASRRLNNLTTKGLGIFCAVYWMFPVNDRLGRMASFCFAFVGLYFSFQTLPMGWYYPPATMLGLLTLERAFANLVARSALSERQTPIRAAAVAALAFLAVGQIALFALTTQQIKIQQAEVEFGTRAQVGLWLREHGKPTDTVYLEPLGYIGYLSGMTMHDCPGLASPMVVQLRRENPQNLIQLIDKVNADWVILRPFEYEAVTKTGIAKWFEEHYELANKFSAVSRLQKYAFIPGRRYLYFDAEFNVFRRRSSPGSSS